MSDIDFENRRICVDHQLVREMGGKYYVEKTKTEAGRRFIPMTPEVYESMKRIVAKRKPLKVEHVIDGYSGFILLDKNDKPKVALHIENEMRWAMHKYKLLHPDKPLPHITPHVFRHTFCTNMATAGMNVKDLQYLMGHSDAEGNEVLIPGTTVICALGQRSRSDEAAALMDSAPFVRVIGDASRVSTITNAVYWGYHAALDI